MKRVSLFLVAFVLLISLLPQEQALAASEQDLLFALNPDGESYCVTSCNATAVGELVIPAAYHGKPVTRIDNFAFTNCDSLTDIIIPDSVTEIADGAFYWCLSGTGVWVAETNPNYSSDTQGALLDKDKTRLIWVPSDMNGEYTVPNNVTVIGDYAFTCCEYLTDIIIPASVTTIEEYAFYWCFNTNGFWVAETNPNYSSDDRGVLFNKDKTTLIHAPGRMDGRYTVPDSVIVIGDNAFDASNIGVVTLGKNVATIGEYAFDSCTGLGRIFVDGENPHYSSDALGVLFNKDKTVLIQAPGNIKEIYTVPSSVTTIGQRAFFFCQRLATVTIQDGVTAIGSHAFASCYNLANICFEGDAPIFDEGVFSGITATVYYPENNPTWTDAVQQNYGGDITWVARDSEPQIVASGDCGDTLTWTLDDRGTLTISGAGDMWDYEAFDEDLPWDDKECEIHKVVIEDGVTHIGDNTFAFFYNITEITIGSDVASIGDSAFWFCENLAGIWVDAANTYYCSDARGILFNKDKTILVDVPETFYGSYTIPDSVTAIGNEAFAGCSFLDRVTMGDNVVSIGEHAFYGCTGLTEITLSNRVTEIGYNAFGSCENIKSITIPASVTTIGGYAFIYCRALNEIFFEGSAPSMGPEVFFEVTATAYYPAGNTTWTEEVRQNYGGNLTWVAVGEEKPSVEWVSASTTLGGNIGLNFYVELSNSLAQDASTFMRFTFAGNTLDVPLSAATLTDGQYKFTCPVNAKNMADAVTAQVMTANGIVGESKELAVVTYCNYMIQYGGDADLASLMKAMLNYGAAAQVLFNHNTQNLANAGLSEADKVLAEVDASGYAASVSGSEEGIALTSASLMLETETSIRIYFKLTGDKTIDQYTFFVDGKKVAPQQKGSEYFVEIPNIAAQDLDAVHTVTVGGIAVTYSGLSYVNTVMNNQAVAGEALVNAAKALFAYNKLAEAYFN